MTSTMGPQQSAVKADLDRVVDDADGDGRSPQAVADPVVGPGEAHRTVLVDDAQDLVTLGRWLRPPCVQRTTVHPVVVIDQMPACMGGDHDAVVRDVQQSISRLDRDGFTDEMTADVMRCLRRLMRPC